MEPKTGTPLTPMTREALIELLRAARASGDTDTSWIDGLPEWTPLPGPGEAVAQTIQTESGQVSKT
jgi:hypothetical protein